MTRAMTSANPDRENRRSGGPRRDRRRVARRGRCDQDGWVNWIPLVSTVFGAAIALGGTVLADFARGRDERGRDSTAARQQAYLDFVLALGAALQCLREVAATPAGSDDRSSSANDALTRANVYPTRERFLMIAPPAVIFAAQLAFDSLVDIRDAVRDGAMLRSTEFHRVYHPYAEKVWMLRLASRDDVGARALRPADLHRDGWDDRANCDVCGAG